MYIAGSKTSIVKLEAGREGSNMVCGNSGGGEKCPEY